MSFRPTVCGVCGEPLPISRGAGRPRRYCSERCRYAARHARDRRARRRRAGEPAEIPVAPDRAQIAASLMLLVDPAAAPAAPEDQLARTLLELRVVESSLRRLEGELPPRLAGPAGKLAGTIGREVGRCFPEVARA